MEFGLTLEQRQFDDLSRVFLSDHLPCKAAGPSPNPVLDSTKGR